MDIPTSPESANTEEELRISQARSAGVLDIADDAIISIDSRQTITVFNQGAEKIFEYTAQEVIGQPIDMLLPSRFNESHRQHLHDFSQSPETARKMGELGRACRAVDT
jgi:PAS domain S-box-containing protein